MAKMKHADGRETLLKDLYKTTGQQTTAELVVDVPEWVEAFPELNAFFTVKTIDGKTRQLPTLTIYADEYGIKAVLADRHGKRKLWLTADSLANLWARLHEALTSRETKWMEESGAGRKRSS